MDRHGYTPLHMAAALNLTAISGRLLAGGALVDPLDKKGRSPLLLAARAGHSATTATLLNLGASVHVKVTYNSPPLSRDVLAFFFFLRNDL